MRKVVSSRLGKRTLLVEDEKTHQTLCQKKSSSSNFFSFIKNVLVLLQVKVLNAIKRVNLTSCDKTGPELVKFSSKLENT